ncbi:MAG: methionyl-tRNA formyltransferase [Burkholderiaceae bacterium]|nr:methionyl-tRNA formyltransferase [Burkholderiaceae bacterium]
MRAGFAGTPEFARLALQAMLQAGFDVPLVLTQPDRPAGRGLKLTPSPVKQLALERDIPVLQPRSLRLDGRYPDDAQQARTAIDAARLDVLVVAAYGLILPAWLLETPRLGCLNIHGSLLPRWRGAAPIQRAIEAGDPLTGITIMQMDEGLDTGGMLLVESLPIDPSDTGSSLHDKLASLGADMIVRALKALDAAEDTGNTLKATPQPVEGVTYAAKLDRAQAALDPHSPAAVLARRVRAFNPVPGATITLPGLPEPVKIWQAQAIPTSVQSAPGTVLRATADGIDIATADGTLRLLELQRAGGKRQPAAIFIQGWSAPV